MEIDDLELMFRLLDVRPTVFVFPSAKDAREFSKKRLTPLTGEIPNLHLEDMRALAFKYRVKDRNAEEGGHTDVEVVR